MARRLAAAGRSDANSGCPIPLKKDGVGDRRMPTGFIVLCRALPATFARRVCLMTTHKTTIRGAFTLIELLVVIAIIVC